MRILTLVAMVAVLVGCGPINRKANFSPLAFTPSVSEKTLPLAAAATACKTVIPSASDPFDDGDRNFSVLWSVNVSMNTPPGRVICAVNSITGEVERMHDGVREVSRSEYQEKIEAWAVGQAYNDTQQTEPAENDMRFSYKGIRIGDPIERVKLSMPLYACGRHGCSFSAAGCSNAHISSEGRVTSTHEDCRSGTSFGGTAISHGSIGLINNKVSSIELTIPTADMRQLAFVLAEKFGQPEHSEETPVQNRMGATFDNWERVWTIGSDRLSAKLRSSKIDEGFVRISGQAAERQQLDGFRKGVDRGAKDF